MAEVRRKDSHLQEALDILDRRFAEAEGNEAVAFASLNDFESKFVDEEILKCMEFRYYAENYHAIQSKHFEQLVTVYPFFESQEIFYSKIKEIQDTGQPVQVIVLKARQLGLSTINQAILFHKTIFTENCNSLIVAQDPGQADYLFTMSRTAYDNLPWWMRPESRYESKGRYLHFDRRDDLERQINPGLRSAIYVEAANRLSGLAVGKAITCAHLSELSLWPDAKVLAEQFIPTLSGTAGQIAVMESTARGRDNFWYDFWKEAWDGKIPWVPIFIEFYRLKKYSLPLPKNEIFERTKEENDLATSVKEASKIDLSDEQIHWRRKKMLEFAALNSGDDSKFFQEYPSSSWVEAFQGSGICAFNKKKLQYMLEKTCHPPLEYGEIDLGRGREGLLNDPQIRLKKVTPGMKPPAAEQRGTRFYVWERPEPGCEYFIAGDVAHGIQGGDFSCAQVIRKGRGPNPDVQVAEWHGWINPTPYANTLAAIGYWYNTAQIAVECNDVGLTTNNHMMRVLEYPNLFRWKFYDKIKNFISEYLGWYTNSKTRDQIIAKFREYIDDDMVIVRSEGLINECFDFASEDDSRFEGQSTHDDRVFAMMICIFCAHDSDGWDVDSQPHTPKVHKEPVKGVDFANTDYSPVHDGKRERDIIPNAENENQPDDYTLWDNSGDSGNDEDWRSI